MGDNDVKKVENAMQILAILKLLYPYIRPQIKKMVEDTGSYIDNMIFDFIDKIICPECAE